MARHQKQTVEYFTHDVNHKKTLAILEHYWGNDGYSFWFKLLEILGKTEGHYFDCRKPDNWEFLLSYTHVSGQTATEILGKLCELEAIDPELWEQNIIWSQNFVDRLSFLYSKRKVSAPEKPRIRGFRDENTTNGGVSTTGNPHSKVKYSKVKQSKANGFSPRKSGDSPITEPEKAGHSPPVAAAADFASVKQKYRNLDLSFTDDKIRQHLKIYGGRVVLGALRKYSSKSNGNLDNPEGYFIGILRSFGPEELTDRNQESRIQQSEELLNNYEKKRQEVKQQRASPEHQKAAKEFFKLSKSKKPPPDEEVPW